jgi:hypothetical protein
MKVCTSNIFTLFKNIETVLDKETIQNAINVENLNAEKTNKFKNLKKYKKKRLWF